MLAAILQDCVNNSFISCVPYFMFLWVFHGYSESHYKVVVQSQIT